MGSQRFCLRWNNHQSNLLSVFDQLLHDEAFVDVTLAVEGQFIRAHKMVLSACSPYFQALFVGHPDKHPIVILKDVPYSDMRSLLDFMYRGEVSVDQDRLTAFLKVAESLRIKGLTEVNEERCDLPTIANSLLNQTSLPPPPPPPPNLHRIHLQPTNPHKRPHPFPPTPVLNSSAISGQKRKRGRPRKLSGSSNPGTPNPSCDDNEEVKINNDNHLGSTPELNQSPQSLTTGPVNQIGRDDSPRRDDNQTEPSSQPQSPDDVKDDKEDDVVAGRTGETGETDCDPDQPSDPDQETEEYNNVKVEGEPKPGTSGQESMPPYHCSTGPPEGVERFPPSESRVHTVRVSICDDVSITPSPHYSLVESSPTSEDVVITPIHDDVSLNPVQFTPGIHFLTRDSYQEELDDEDSSESTTPGRRDLLEYLINEDGSVVCKWCGELLPSRTHWYRHKYKFHISNPPGTTSLFKCYKCNLFFKSRKGYLGHVTSRHRVEPKIVIEKEELKPFKRGRRPSEDLQGNPEEYEKQREKEEKLVADIIDRVKRECEAQGSTVTRKGYSRRSTIMNT